jgi:hypothetical protein
MADSLKTLKRMPRRCLGLATLLSALAGCQGRYQDPGLPAPAPFGSNVNAIVRTQVEGAYADKLTIYRHEWFDDGDRPGDYGTRHLDTIVNSALDTDHLILIEKDPTDAKLNQLRREYVISYLTDHDIPDAAGRVVIGRPVARGELSEDGIDAFNARPTANGGSAGGGGTGGGR